jgi:hypothetical protein
VAPLQHLHPGSENREEGLPLVIPDARKGNSPGSSFACRNPSTGVQNKHAPTKEPSCPTSPYCLPR